MGRALLVLGAIAACGALLAPVASADEETGRYIVVFRDSVQRPGDLAHSQIDHYDGDMHAFYRHALEGYAATLPKDEVAALRRDPRVELVTPDHKVGLLEETVELETFENEGIELFESSLPTGIQRTFASSNKELKIDGTDNLRADVDVAVIDTGIDYEHPDLNVVKRTICTSGTCIDNSGTDDHYHGTHVAGTIGAIDNGIGVVGVAPGARMWGVKVLNSGGSGQESWIIAGVDWVTAHASEIEVANMSLGCNCSMPALDSAINKSIEAGVVYTVAAGNSASDAKNFSPASNPNVITVSALTDYDGKPGGTGSATCEYYGPDDRNAAFSNYGTIVDIAAPGICILSSTPGGEYAYLSGTSMASPHVAGAAAILATQKNPGSKADVETIRNTLVAAGNTNWTDTSPDGVKEPLLDVSNESTFTIKVEPPVNTGVPALSSLYALQGVPNSVTTGTWKNNPTSYAYQWQRCNSPGTECSNISEATKSSYTPVEADVGKYLIAKVTASNSAGSTSANSKSIGKVKPLGQITEYATPSGAAPFGIAKGPDGNLWFTNSTKNKIGKVTTGGTITEYSNPGGSWPAGITAGPDGNLWFNNSGNGVISKSTMAGSITGYSLGFLNMIGITAGPDGNLWFTATEGKIGKVTTPGTATTYTLPKESNPQDITAGPDGKLWFVNYGTNKIGKSTTAGSITEYALSAGSGPRSIASGPDGNLWFTRTYADKIGKISTSGTVTEYSVSAGSRPEGIVAGPDGNLWFANSQSSKIGRITTSGTITEYALPEGSGPKDVTVGPDLQIWFTDYGSGKIGTIVP